jgi:type IV pilus assembly protein PilO
MALNVNKLNDIPWYAQLGLFLVVGCLVVGVGWYFFISGLSTQIEIKQKKLNALNDEIHRGQAVEQKHLEFQLQNQRLFEKLATLKKILPEAKQTDDLLRQIQGSALSSGLIIKRFEPKVVVAKDFFSEWPIQMDVEGGYHTLGIFFDKISKLSRIVNVSNVSIKQNARAENPNRTILASYTATTFVYNENVPETPVEEPNVQKGKPKAKK